MSGGWKGWKLHGDRTLTYNAAQDACYNDYGATLWRVPENREEAQAAVYLIWIEYGRAQKL